MYIMHFCSIFLMTSRGLQIQVQLGMRAGRPILLSVTALCARFMYAHTVNG